MNKLQQNVLTALSSTSSPLSGEVLAKTFSVSRVAISKAVHALQKEGYAIVAYHSVGYALLPSEKLYKEGIKLDFSCTVSVFDSIGSTSVEARKSFQNAPLLVLSASQTEGKGRRDTAFPSPASGLYFTLALPTFFSVAQLPSMQEKLLSCISEHFSVERKEHALLSDGKKVGGVLIESNVEYADCTALIIGIGYYPFVKDKLSCVSNLSNKLYRIVNPSL